MKVILSFLLTLQVCLCQTAGIRGQVTDESGAVIPGAKVTLRGPSNFEKSLTSANDGTYSFTGLTAGDYSIQAAAPELAMPAPAKFTVKAGVLTVNIQLKVAATAQQVTIQENAGPAVSADPSNNASALVLRGSDLDALSDDPEDLATDLQALAGPAAGPNGGSIFIDGFSGGQLPSKESIREVRINQNPFSPEYDKLGYGRIEIFTKPGADKFRGTGFYNFGDKFWNTRNPYAAEKAPFILKEYGGNLSGPLAKKASFTLDVERHSVNNGAIINGVTLDPSTLAVIDPYTNVFLIPQRRIMASPRVDYQLTPNNTITARYSFIRMDIQDFGVGGFNLTDRGAHLQTLAHTGQVSETAVIGAHVINETRFQFYGLEHSNYANGASPAVQVLGSFAGGGASVGRSYRSESDYEIQNYTSVLHGSHSIKFGLRLRGAAIDDTAPTNFNGTFTFGGANGLTSIAQYRQTLLGISGVGPTQFTLNAGDPYISGSQWDAGIFAGDDWRARPNLTFSFGLRYEAQTNLSDRRDIAPRIGVAWAPGGTAKNPRPKTVLRAGFGIFYDRFDLANTLAARRANGIIEQQYVITNPTFFPAIPPLASLTGFRSAQTIQELSSSLRAPYILQPAVSLERQLPANTTVAVTYANSHGLHELRSGYVAALNPIYLMESAGLYNQNQLIVNVNSKVNSKVSLFGYYMYNRALSNTDGLGTFPANPANYAGEYGPASTDIRNRVAMGGSLSTKWNIRLSPLVIVDSGPPFDITIGRDIYGDTLLNARPGVATDPSKPGLVPTPYGLLDPNPTPGEQILPRNFGRGPGSVNANIRITKTIGFGPAKEGAGATVNQGDRRLSGGAFGTGGGRTANVTTNKRYNLSISMSIRNLLNHTNPGPIIGNLLSPNFGQANQPAGQRNGEGFSEAANNRRLELQMRLSF